MSLMIGDLVICLCSGEKSIITSVTKSKVYGTLYQHKHLNNGYIDVDTEMNFKLIKKGNSNSNIVI